MAFSPGPCLSCHQAPIGSEHLSSWLSSCLQEALCERVAIMNKGRLVCLGTPHHLKARFGACYDIEVICSSSPTHGAGPQGGHTTTHSSTDKSGAAAAGDEPLLLSPAQQALLSQLRAVMPGLVVREAAWGRMRMSLPLAPGAPPLSRVFEVSSPTRL